MTATSTDPIVTGGQWRSIEDQFSIPSYAKWPITLVKGLGTRVWDDAGVEYLDFYGGHCVALIGHSHPKWVEAIAQQAARFGFYSNVAYNDVRAAFQMLLLGFTNAERLQRVFLCNSGTEANETAIKLALKATGRTGIIAMEGGFHGRTAGALSVTHLGDYRRQFPSIVHQTHAVPFGDLPALKGALRPDTAVVILEPIQSMNGMATAEPEYYQGLVAACHANGTLVIFDEIQTGMGRLGASFASELFQAPADIITTAKGIGNGYPLGAVLTTEAVAKTVAQGEQGTTFGGGPLACAAGLAVIGVVKQEGLIEHAAAMERYARRTLIRGPIRGIRGRGLLLGLETTAPAKALTKHLFDHHILAGTSSNPNVVRLMPPLVITREDFDRLAAALDSFRG